MDIYKNWTCFGIRFASRPPANRGFSSTASSSLIPLKAHARKLEFFLLYGEIRLQPNLVQEDMALCLMGNILVLDVRRKEARKAKDNILHMDFLFNFLATFLQNLT